MTHSACLLFQGGVAESQLFLYTGRSVVLSTALPFDSFLWMLSSIQCYGDTNIIQHTVHLQQSRTWTYLLQISWATEVGATCVAVEPAVYRICIVLTTIHLAHGAWRHNQIRNWLGPAWIKVVKRQRRVGAFDNNI